MIKREKKSTPKRIKVVNRYKHEATIDDVYIGRGSHLGSSYSHLPSKYKDVTLCDTREEALELYKEFFTDAMNGCGCKYKDLKNELRKIIVNLRLGQEINLVCYCKPKDCHGDIIRDFILTQV